MCFSVFGFNFDSARVKAESSVTPETAGFTLDIEAPATAIKGEIISVFITVKDIKQELNAVEFHLAFDKTKVKGVVQGKTNVDSTENDPLDDLMHVKPMYTAVIDGVEIDLSRYEQIVKYNEEDGEYECKFVDLLNYPNAKDGQEFNGLKNDGDLVIKIDFEVLDTVSLEDEFVFSTVDKTVKGTTREGFNRVYGYADEATTTVAKIPDWAYFELDIKSTPASAIDYNVDVEVTIKNIKKELNSVEFALGCNDFSKLKYISVTTSDLNYESTHTLENGVHSFKISANGPIIDGLVMTIKFQILNTAAIDDVLEFSIVDETAKATTVDTSETVPGYTPNTATTTVEEQGTVSGFWGNLSWVLDAEHILTISGTGEMMDFNSFSDTPWYMHQDKIVKVVIEDGITNISNNAFKGCSAIKSIWIPKTVTNIGDYSFDGCNALENVYYGGSLKQWYKISVETNNEPLRNAKTHFAHTQMERMEIRNSSNMYSGRFKHQNMSCLRC